MKKIIRYIKNSIKWLWQFPQNILALCLEGILCEAAIRDGEVDGNVIIRNIVLPTSVSFGDYIFTTPLSSRWAIQHECGHSKQSDILGPLYLVVIGIPSVVHNIVHKICKKLGINWDYYKFYTESWANKLAKIDSRNSFMISEP